MIIKFKIMIIIYIHVFEFGLYSCICKPDELRLTMMAALQEKSSTSAIVGNLLRF